MAGVVIMPLPPYNRLQRGRCHAAVVTGMYAHVLHTLLNLHKHGPPGIALQYPKQCQIDRYLQNALHNVNSHSAWNLHNFFVNCLYPSTNCPVALKAISGHARELATYKRR